MRFTYTIGESFFMSPLLPKNHIEFYGLKLPTFLVDEMVDYYGANLFG